MKPEVSKRVGLAKPLGLYSDILTKDIMM